MSCTLPTVAASLWDGGGGVSWWLWVGGRVAEEVRVSPIDAFFFDDAHRERPTGAWLQRTAPRSSRTAIPYP
jgi:hypothetical protein